MALKPICEYLDVLSDGSGVRLALRIRGVERPEGEHFALRLVDRRGRTMTTAVGKIQPRVSTVGVWRRSSLLFELPVADLPDGAFRLDLRSLPAPDTPMEMVSGTPVASPRGPVPEPVPSGRPTVPASAASVSAPAPIGPIALAPSTGLLAASRPLAIEGGRWIQAFPAAGREAVWLRVGSPSTLGRLRWQAAAWGRDLAFAAHTRRFTWVRPARLLTRPLAPRGQVWLVGERPETARDNGRAFFEHLRATRPDEPIYYVINRDSPMRAVVEPLGNVVDHSSWRHRLLMLHARVLVNAYSIKHMLPDRWHPGAYMKQGAWRTGALRVYLKHGVHLSPYAVKRANGGYDLLAAVGEHEAEALRATSGYDDEVVVTGLARYDALVKAPTPSRTILFMPTWRRYLVPTLFSGEDQSQVAYAGSTYEHFITGFLRSERLAQLLERYDLTLQLVPHYNLGSLLRASDLPIDSERIEVLDASSADIPALLRSCDLLVTDYSSVQFDVAYVGTPVVYFQFDRDEYVSGHSAFSWFEVDRDGFGPVTTDIDSTVATIQRYAEDGFRREPRYEERVRSVFTYRDRHNSERLARRIDALLGREVKGA